MNPENVWSVYVGPIPETVWQSHAWGSLKTVQLPSGEYGVAIMNHWGQFPGLDGRGQNYENPDDADVPVIVGG